MSSIKNKNNYTLFENYDKSSICGEEKHYHPNHNLADSKGCMKNSDMKEPFISLYSAVRMPFSPSRYDPNYKQPHLDGRCFCFGVPCTY